MALSYTGTADECPYDLVSRSIAGCPRFSPRVVFDRLHGPIITCTHVRASLARPAPGDNTAATFYPRCALKTGGIEAERSFAVPMD